MQLVSRSNGRRTITVSRLPRVGMMVARLRYGLLATVLTKTARFRQVGLSVQLGATRHEPQTVRYGHRGRSYGMCCHGWHGQAHESGHATRHCGSPRSRRHDGNTGGMRDTCGGVARIRDGGFTRSARADRVRADRGMGHMGSGAGMRT
jgi:hypothetical protein